MANNQRKFLYLIPAVLLVSVSACAPTEKEAAQEIRPVRVIAVDEHQAGQTVQLAGTIESQTQVELAFRNRR